MCLTESIAFTLVGALTGYLVSSRLAIDRDRRKEFNNLIEPVRLALLSARNYPTSNLKEPIYITFALVCERLPFWKRKGFDRAVENYKKSKGNENRDPDGMGGFLYKDTARIVYAVNDLLRFIKPR